MHSFDGHEQVEQLHFACIWALVHQFFKFDIFFTFVKGVDEKLVPWLLPHTLRTAWPSLACCVGHPWLLTCRDATGMQSISKSLKGVLCHANVEHCMVSITNVSSP